MKAYRITAVCLLALGLAVSAQARIDEINEKIPMDGAKRITLDCEFAAGDLNIEPGAINNALEVIIQYNSRKFDPVVDHVLKGDIRDIILETHIRNHHNNISDDDNDWDIVLSDKYPIDASFEIGACDAEIDFGGVPFTDLSIEVGAASGRIAFSKPNPERIREFSIEAGASSLDLESLGNANFERLTFEGGVGSFTLDLTGTYTGESEVDVEVGMASADIILPKGLPVRIESKDEHMFNSIDIHGGPDLDEIDDGEYESSDFDTAKVRLTLHLSVGMGSLDVRWR